jgi:hypothetical protein
MRALSGETVTFGWFGWRVELATDSRRFGRILGELWNACPEPPPDRPPKRFRVLLGGPGGPRYEGPDGRVRLLDRRHPALHAYHLLVTELLGSVGDHFALHGTTVVREGEGMLLSGPSNFGKTTLAIHLARRGWALLAEDVSFLERASGRAIPFPRTLHLRPGTRETLSCEDLDRAATAAEDPTAEEWAIRPGEILPLFPTPAGLRVAVILRSPEDAGGFRRFPLYEIRLAQDAEPLLRELPGLDGIDGFELPDEDPLLVRLRVKRAAALVAWLAEHRDEVVSATKLPGSAPVFEGPPRLEPVGPFQAAVELGQEMLNRHPGSRIAEEFSGREAELVLELGEMLRKARCYALLPGRLEQTLDLLEAAFEEKRP